METARRLTRSRGGFTLLEVLVVLALIAMLTGVLVVGVNRLLRERPMSPDELFWSAVAATRKDALLNNHDVRLSLDPKTQQFVSTTTVGVVVISLEAGSAGGFGSGHSVTAGMSTPLTSANASNSSESPAPANPFETRHPFVAKEVAELDFLAPKSTGSSSVLIGGQLVETLTLPSVMFYRDGTCSPFRVQLKTRNGARVLEIDPWTCAQMLSAQPAS